MRKKTVAAMALAVGACLASRSYADDPKGSDEEKKKPEAGSLLLPAAIGLAGVAAVAAFAGRRGGNGAGNASTGTTGGGSTAGNPAPTSPRTLTYTSPADFETPEYNAERGLRWVNASSMYYNGHYAWYGGNAPDPAAGTGVGVKIALADTGINALEAKTGTSIRVDVASSYDYINNRAGAAADDFGHGTHVAGVLAAPKNGSGMHGLAYNATLINFKVGDSSGAITASDAQLGDMIQRAGNAGAMIINASWALAGRDITSFTAQDLQSGLPRMIDASRAYVAKGGVVVFAAGNDGAANPAMQAGLPYRVGGIEPGWLAVVAIDDTGKLASYSNRCGVAATWCLAAPGGSATSGIYSMYNDGGYAFMYGTSLAAPHASAAIAALKSMFVNLSYLQIRDRLLFTANRSGAYGDASTYGQGLIDLAAASSPVGGISVPTAASANGATSPVSGSMVELQPGAVQALRMQPWVLVVDNYQRAPFWIPTGSLFHEATPALLDRQWASLASGGFSARSQKTGPGLRFGYAPGLHSAVSANLGTYRIGFSQGAGGENMLGSQLEFASLPHLAAPAVNSVGLGYSADLGALRLGFVGTLPTAAASEARTLDSSLLGGRNGIGAIAQLSDGRTTYGVTVATADHFERPIGTATSGAFAIAQSAAFSSGAFVRHALSASTVFDASLEVARHRPQADLALSAPPYGLRSANFGARTTLGGKTMFSATLKREWTSADAARLNLPLTIAENGDIGRVAYALPYDDLVGRTALTLRVDHEFNRRIALRASVTHERYGFGAALNGVAAMLEIAN